MVNSLRLLCCPGSRRDLTTRKPISFQRQKLSSLAHCLPLSHHREVLTELLPALRSLQISTPEFSFMAVVLMPYLTPGEPGSGTAVLNLFKKSDMREIRNSLTPPWGRCFAEVVNCPRDKLVMHCLGRTQKVNGLGELWTGQGEGQQGHTKTSGHSEHLQLIAAPQAHVLILQGFIATG